MPVMGGWGLTMRPGETDLLGPAMVMVAMVAIVSALLACYQGLRAIVRMVGTAGSWWALPAADDQDRPADEAPGPESDLAESADDA